MKQDFEKAILSIPAEQRCIQSSGGRWDLPIGYCLFGVPESRFFGWTKLNELPSTSKGFKFYLGSDNIGVFESFASSEYAGDVEYLFIGDSSFGLGRGRDYSDIVAALENRDFPQLKELHLGTWELFSNSHCLYGNIGDLSILLGNAPNLEVLRLGGRFDLRKRLAFAKLRDIVVNLDDRVTGANGGFISNDTLSNLLCSEFPNLEKSWFDLVCDDNDYGYTLPRNFLSGDSMPRLKSLEISGGFVAGEDEKMRASQLSLRASTEVSFTQY